MGVPLHAGPPHASKNRMLSKSGSAVDCDMVRAFVRSDAMGGNCCVTMESRRTGAPRHKLELLSHECRVLDRALTGTSQEDVSNYAVYSRHSPRFLCMLGLASNTEC